LLYSTATSATKIIIHLPSFKISSILLPDFLYLSKLNNIGYKGSEKPKKFSWIFILVPVSISE